MKDRLLIIGASGHGKVVADIALKMKCWKYIAFLDDDETLQSSLALRVIGKADDAFRNIDDADIFVAIGNNTIRQMFLCKLKEAGANIPVLVHNSAIIGEHIEIGEGTAIMAGVVINCCTKIGKGCIINTGATVDHDNVIDDYVHISPGATLAGSVSIGTGAWIGSGSVVSNNIQIIGGCKIGAGAVVIRDITEPGTYIGVPARRL